jgi:hypothetical protein
LEVVDPPPVVAAGAFLVVLFLWVFLAVVVAGLELLVVLLLAGGFCGAGVVCAKATVEATAKAIAIRLFFIFFFSRRAFFHPPYISRMPPKRRNLDSLRRLWKPPNWGTERLRLLHHFIRTGGTGMSRALRYILIRRLRELP